MKNAGGVSSIIEKEINQNEKCRRRFINNSNRD